MNRCLKDSHRRIVATCLALAAGLTWLAPAMAQDTVLRTPPIPATAQRGMLVVTQPPEVLLDGQPGRLSPGARIRGRNNLLVLSASLVGQELLVRYARDPQGQIHDVWILTDAEAQRQP